MKFFLNHNLWIIKWNKIIKMTYSYRSENFGDDTEYFHYWENKKEQLSAMMPGHYPIHVAEQNAKDFL